MSSASHLAKRSLPALLALLALAPGAAAPLGAQQTPAPTPATTTEHPPTNPLAVPSRTPPVRVTLSEEELVPGDRVRVLVRPRADGYLVVLHADPAGRVRVLFPLDPGDSQRAQGATQRSIPSRDGSASFVVASSTGDGAVLAAVATTPFRVAAFASGGHWDVRAFPRLAANADPEGELVAVARRMAGGAHFDFAVAPYRVTEGLPVVAYGRGAYDQRRAYARDNGSTTGPTMAAGGYYYNDAYVYGYPLYYAGLLPALRWPGLYSPCAAHGRGSTVLRSGCNGYGRVPQRGRRPWGQPSEGQRAWRDDPTFPGNPDFGEPRSAGEPTTAPRAVAPSSGAPEVSARAAGDAQRAAPPPPSGGMIGLPARPLGVSPQGRQPPPPASAPRRPSAPRMP